MCVFAFEEQIANKTMLLGSNHKSLTITSRVASCESRCVCGGLKTLIRRRSCFVSSNFARGGRALKDANQILISRVTNAVVFLRKISSLSLLSLLLATRKVIKIINHNIERAYAPLVHPRFNALDPCKG